MAKKTLLPFLLLFLSISLGILIRIHNLTPFTIYPDSYVPLLIAENLNTYHSVTGFLGTSGMFYPPLFFWSRPGYPLLINLISPLIGNNLIAAHAIAFFSGILSLLLTYFFLSTLFRSRGIGIMGTLLLALSFNHSVWGGFILTEPVSILFLLSTLWTLTYTAREKSPQTAILSGILFACSVLIRYEYSILLIPFCLFLLQFKNARKLILIFICTLISVLLLAWLIYFPPGTIEILLRQMHTLLLILLLGGFGGVSSMLIWIKLSSSRKKKLQQLLPISIIICLGIIFCFSTLFALGNFYPKFLPEALFLFFRDDFLLSGCALLGLMLFFKTTQKKLGYFVLGSMLLLLVIYLYINPAMERYLTHLIPFLLIPASYFFFTLLQWIHARFFQTGSKLLPLSLSTLLFILLVYQGYHAYQGTRIWKDSSWLQTSYERKAAEKTQQVISTPTSLLLVSFPEPYFYQLQHPTYSIADTYPYLFIDNKLNNKIIFIVEDMGMRDIFPHFAAFLDTHLQNKRIASFWVGTAYHYADKSTPESYPVQIYQTTVGELKKSINQAKKEM